MFWRAHSFNFFPSSQKLPLDVLHSLSHARVEYLNAYALSPFANIHLLRLPIFQKLEALIEKRDLLVCTLNNRTGTRRISKKRQNELSSTSNRTSNSKKCQNQPSLFCHISKRSEILWTDQYVCLLEMCTETLETCMWI